MNKLKKSKENTKKYIATFRYFDDNFYQFLSLTSKGKTNKKIKFKDKTTKILTPNDALLLKYYMDRMDHSYNRRLKHLLDNPNTIQNILNNYRNIKKYK